MEREGGAVPLLLDCEIVEEPTDVGEEEIADLGLESPYLHPLIINML